MNPFRRIANALNIVFSNAKYALLFAAFAVVSMFVLIWITSIPGQSIGSWLFGESLATKAFVLVASLLLATIFTLQAFVAFTLGFGKLGKKETGSGVVSFLVGIVSISCCSPFVLPLLGIAGFSAIILKYQSTFFLLAIVLLVVSLYYSSKIVDCDECRVRLGVRTRPSKR